MNTSVVIEALELDCVIGVYDFERKFEQRVLADIEISHDFKAALASDRLIDTLDYAAVCERCRTIAREGGYQLLERLAGAIVDCLRSEFGVSRLRLRLRKPGAVQGTGYVGVVVDTH